MNDETLAIGLKNVRLTLTGGSGPVNVLCGLNLEVARGETVSVLGPSGSGKTTMLMIVSGLERPTTGSVTVAGRDIQSMGEDELARFRRSHVAIVFQGFHLVPTMTALENAALPLEFAGSRTARDRAMECLERVGLGRRAGHYPSQLSGGEQQRVAIARAFAPEPDILLADEPTGNLDAETGAMVMDTLFDLQTERGGTLLLVTHDKGLSQRTSRRVHMRDGLIVAPGEISRPCPAPGDPSLEKGGGAQ